MQSAVNAIAERAREFAYDPNYMSPFAEHARENGMEFLGMYWNGHGLKHRDSIGKPVKDPIS